MGAVIPIHKFFRNCQVTVFSKVFDENSWIDAAMKDNLLNLEDIGNWSKEEVEKLRRFGFGVCYFIRGDGTLDKKRIAVSGVWSAKNICRTLGDSCLILQKFTAWLVETEDGPNIRLFPPDGAGQKRK